MPEGDDTRAADELPAAVEGVAVPQQGPSAPDGAVRVPDDAVTVPDAAPEPLEEPPDVPMPPLPETGEPRVDAAVAPLRDLGGQPTEEHVAGYEAAHSGLQDVLADLDRDPDGT